MNPIGTKAFETPADLASLEEQGAFRSFVIEGEALMLAPGETVGAYEAVHRLGVGGVSEVWVVRHVHSGEERALKVLHRPSPNLVRRLISECVAHLYLAHPNILPILGCVRHEGQFALLMPVVQGPSLGQLLARGPRLSQPEALSLLRGVMRAVAHAHEQRIVHRDLKPDNVMLDLSGPVIVPRVTDFGIARRLDDMTVTRAGSILGTPTFCAPEQLVDASSADARADIFSLGVMLVRMLTGNLPFKGVNVREVREAHGRPPDLHDLSDDLRSLARALLAKDPDNRLPTVAAMAAALDALDLEVTEPLSFDYDGARGGPPSGLGPTQERVSSLISIPTLCDEVPLPRTALVGRDAPLDQLTRHLAPQDGRKPDRLVTLSGSGGVGKTRLALELAHMLVAGDQAVIWADLDLLAPGQSVSHLLLSRLTSPVRGRSQPEEHIASLVAHLRRLGPSLIILDTADGHRRQLGQIIDSVTKHTEDVRFLITSRAPLRLPGERVVSLHRLDSEGAWTLFRTAAVLAGHSLPDTRDLRTRCEALINRVDARPLAIELLAEQLGSTDLDTLQQMTRSQLLVLESTERERVARHRSIEACLEWSWSRLPADDEILLAQCSVFHGEFTLEAAGEVLGSDDPIRLRCRMGALADTGLLRRRFSTSGRLRLGFPSMGRSFAAQRLDELGEQRNCVHRHAQYYGHLEAQAWSPTGRAARDAHASRTDLPDLFAVAENIEFHQDPALSAQALLAAVRLGARSYQGRSVVAMVERVMAKPLPPVLRARLQVAYLHLLEEDGEIDVIRKEMPDLRRDLRKLALRPQLADMYLLRARMRMWCAGRAASVQTDIGTAARIFETPRTHLAKAQLLLLSGRLHAAERAIGKAMDLARPSGQEESRAEALIILSQIQLEHLSVADAMEAAARSRDLAETVGNSALLAQALAQEARCLATAGRIESASKVVARATDLLSHADASLLADRVNRVSVTCLALQGRHVASAALAGTLARRFHARGQLVEYVGVRLQQAQLFTAQGQLTAAGHVVNELDNLLASVDLGMLRSLHAAAVANLEATRGRGRAVVIAVEPWLGHAMECTPRVRVELQLHRARALATEGDFQGAMTALEDLIQLTNARGLTAEEARIRCIMAQLLHHFGLTRRAITACDQAATLVEGTGAWSLHQEMSKLREQLISA